MYGELSLRYYRMVLRFAPHDRYCISEIDWFSSLVWTLERGATPAKAQLT